MAIELNSLISVIEKSYAPYYNIYKEEFPASIPCVFRATYFGKSQPSIFPKVGNEYYDHVYLFSQRKFDADTVDKCLKFAITDGRTRIKPDTKLREADIKALFVSNGYTNDAIAKIESSEFEEKHKTAFFAKTVLIACAADANLEKTYKNSKGREMACYFRDLFYAQHSDWT